MSELLDLSSEPATVTLDGEVYILHKLTLADQARAERMIRDDRLTHFLKTSAQHAHVAAQPEVMGAAIGAIECATIKTEELFNSRAYQLYILAASLASGNKTMTDRQALAKVQELPHMTVTTLMSIIGHISGLVVADNTSPDPTMRPETSSEAN